MKKLTGLLIFAVTIVAVSSVSANNPPPEPPPSGLLMCEVTDDGAIKLTAFDAPDAGFDLRIGMSCMAAVSMLRVNEFRFSFNWFDVGGVAKFGIIIINGEPTT